MQADLRCREQLVEEALGGDRIEHAVTRRVLIRERLDDTRESGRTFCLPVEINLQTVGYLPAQRAAFFDQHGLDAGLRSRLRSNDAGQSATDNAQLGAIQKSDAGIEGKTCHE